MSRLFISYSHKDQKFVSLLAKGLKLAGCQLWRDIEMMSGGQSLSREVETGIANCSVFLSVISPHFDSSKWLPAELSRATDSGAKVIPLILPGATVPLLVNHLVQVRLAGDSEEIGGSEILRLLEEIRVAVGQPRPNDFDLFDDDSSSDDDGVEPSLEKCLIGTRWSWCENPWAEDHGLWIEFLAGGELRRSWRSERTRWRVTSNNLVIYKPHVLTFNLQKRRFYGAVGILGERPERTGRLVSGSVGFL